MANYSIQTRKSIGERLKLYKFRWHHYIDFLVGIAIIALLFVLDLPGETMERRILFTIAAALILTNLITKHKSGLTEMLSVSTHLRIDLFLGVILGITPFVYDSELQLQLCCLIFAMVIVLNALFSKVPKKQQLGHDLI